MKVVLFCGGQGLRLREYAENVPKPMVPIGYRPILWHLMKYYAHYGHHDFILCLGYKADVIKDYFLNYRETVSNDLVMSNGGKDVKLLGSDITDWSITFVDTGVDSNIGQRLMAVREHLAGEEVFMANYADNLTDLPLPKLVDHFKTQDKIATMLSVRLRQSFHVVRINDDSSVQSLIPAQQADVWINGGYFVFKREIFDYINDGEELVLEPLQRLVQRNQLTAYRHTDFWACMDTFKERQVLEDLHMRGRAPWEVWIKRRKTVAQVVTHGMIRAGLIRDLRNVMCLGAHSDDIEIGCGGSILRLTAENPQLNIIWVVFSANATRAREAKRGAELFLKKAKHKKIVVHHFRDGHFPFQGSSIKTVFERLKRQYKPDLIFTHFGEDRHQDHRTLSALTWNTWRDHLILEYEIPKYDGDLGRPNFYVPLSSDICQRKARYLQEAFSSQASRQWFSKDLFMAPPRLRGVECNSPTRFAEAFHCRKLLV